MSQTHLFVMDPFDRLNLALDSSLRMAIELDRQGHAIYICEARRLAWQSEHKGAVAYAQRVHFPNGEAAKAELEATLVPLPLRTCQGIHMRKDPPFNAEYIACTWLLESAVKEAHIFNSPQALRSFNEKLAIFQFPDAIAPALVSSQAAELLAFVEENCGGDGIIKPLDLYGGRGIFRLELEKIGKAKALQLLDEATVQGSSWRLAQAFNPKIFDGELRVFAVGGEPLSWCLKKPQNGNFLANTSAGATLSAYTASADLSAKVRKVATSLYKAGVSLAGFDMIGGVISEINITSPRLLHAADDKSPYYAHLAAWIIRTCSKSPVSQPVI